ncbi:hypothetical protein [Bacteroides clarus]
MLCYPFIISSDFHPSSSPLWKATEVNTAIRRLVGRTSILQTDRGKPMLQAKREQHPKTADTPQAFGKQKAIAH